MLKLYLLLISPFMYPHDTNVKHMHLTVHIPQVVSTIDLATRNDVIVELDDKPATPQQVQQLKDTIQRSWPKRKAFVCSTIVALTAALIGAGATIGAVYLGHVC